MKSINELSFDANAYEVKTCIVEEESITYRAFTNLLYCTNQEDPIQKMNLFVPEAYYNGETIHGYSIHTAPIFLLNTVGGYLPGPATEPGSERKGGRIMLFQCLQHGYVVASVGLRGRSSGTKNNEFFEGGIVRTEETISDHFTGKAPALVVDMKAAIRYLRYNRENLPGDVEHMIMVGTSAGGALTALIGATGNSVDYEPYLEKIGAAKERDDIYAVNCYCPIHNLEHADMAYEWQFSGIWDYHRTKHVQQDGQVIRVPEEGELTPEEQEVSRQLAALFPAYVNSLKLHSSDGTMLTLDEKGEGSFKDYIIRLLMQSAQYELETHASCDGLADRAIPNARVETLSCVQIRDGKVVGLDWDAYLRFIGRMKNAPAFDALDLSTAENEEFGTETLKARHFTTFSLEHSKVDHAQLADDSIVKQMNPLNYIGVADTAQYWRVRQGTADRDTSFAIPTILATVLQNKGFEVDYRLPWALPHGGGYDIPELFAWVDGLMEAAHCK